MEIVEINMNKCLLDNTALMGGKDEGSTFPPTRINKFPWLKIQ